MSYIYTMIRVLNYLYICVCDLACDFLIILFEFLPLS